MTLYKYVRIVFRMSFAGTTVCGGQIFALLFPRVYRDNIVLRSPHVLHCMFRHLAICRMKGQRACLCNLEACALDTGHKTRLIIMDCRLGEEWNIIL